MKRKASSRRLVPAVFYSSTQKSREILELQKQLHVMQQKIRTIEDTQRSIQASTIVTLPASEQTRSKNEESKKKTFEDEVFQPSTSKKSNGKRKRRREDASEEEQGNSYESLVSILLHFLKIAEHTKLPIFMSEKEESVIWRIISVDLPV